MSYADGIAIIATPSRRSEVNVAVTADLFIDGFPIPPTKTDSLALSLGYRALSAEVDRLTEELAAARAGTMGKEHAEAMHGARKVIAELNKAVADFMEEYDKGDGPDGVPLRDAAGAAEHWLLCDVKAAGERAKVLKGGAA